MVLSNGTDPNPNRVLWSVTSELLSWPSSLPKSKNYLWCEIMYYYEILLQCHFWVKCHSSPWKQVWVKTQVHLLSFSQRFHQQMEWSVVMEMFMQEEVDFYDNWPNSISKWMSKDFCPISLWFLFYYVRFSYLSEANCLTTWWWSSQSVSAFENLTNLLISKTSN